MKNILIFLTIFILGNEMLVAQKTEKEIVNQIKTILETPKIMVDEPVKTEITFRVLDDHGVRLGYRIKLISCNSTNEKVAKIIKKRLHKVFLKNIDSVDGRKFKLPITIINKYY